MDYGQPYASANHIEGYALSPLLMLMRWHCSPATDTIQIPSKTALILSRGADCRIRDSNGNTCLHRFMRYGRENMTVHRRPYENIVISGYDGELKDMFMLLITAGADACAQNNNGVTPSDIAHHLGHVRECREALEECGYDPHRVETTNGQDVCWSSAIDLEPKTLQRPLLTFKEYLVIRKSRLRVEDVSGDEMTDEDRTDSIVQSDHWSDEDWDSLDDDTDEANSVGNNRNSHNYLVDAARLAIGP